MNKGGYPSNHLIKEPVWPRSVASERENDVRLNWLRLALAMSLPLAVIGMAGCNSSQGTMITYEEVESARNAAIDSLRNRGAKLKENQYPQGKAWSVGLVGAVFDEELVETLTKIGPLTELDLSGSNVTDEDLVKICVPSACGALLKLDISDTPVSDAGLSATHDLKLLHELNVTGSKVTAAGIEKFRQSRPAKMPFGFKLKIEQ